MSRPTKKSIAKTGFGLAGGGSLSVLAATGWPVVALAGLLLTTTTTLCWILSDSARTRRATTLIKALRRSPTP